MQLSSSLESDACIWYLTTNILDNTIGVFLCVGVLSLIERYLFNDRYYRYQSGNYYTVLKEYEEEKSYSGSMVEGDHVRALEITTRRTRYA
jgi:hypothetical protein